MIFAEFAFRAARPKPKMTDVTNMPANPPQKMRRMAPIAEIAKPMTSTFLMPMRSAMVPVTMQNRKPVRYEQLVSIMNCWASKAHWPIGFKRMPAMPANTSVEPFTTMQARPMSARMIQR